MNWSLVSVLVLKTETIVEPTKQITIVEITKQLVNQLNNCGTN